MRLLPDRDWLTKYSPESGDLVADFYIPALECAVRYDRSTGYFSAYALALAARGIEDLVRNRGRMRLVVGCTLKPQDVAAIQQGADSRITEPRTPFGPAPPGVGLHPPCPGLAGWRRTGRRSDERSDPLAPSGQGLSTAL
jgi:hypothetical protein